MVTFGTKKDVSPYKCLTGIVGSGSREGICTAGEVPRVIAPHWGDRAVPQAGMVMQVICEHNLLSWNTFLEHLSPKFVILWRLFWGSSGTLAITDCCLSMWVLWHCQQWPWGDQGPLLKFIMVGKEKLLVLLPNLLVKGKQQRGTVDLVDKCLAVWWAGICLPQEWEILND